MFLMPGGGLPVLSGVRPPKVYSTPPNRVPGQKRRETENTADERNLPRSPHKTASCTGLGAFSDFQGNLKFFSAIEA